MMPGELSQILCKSNTKKKTTYALKTPHVVALPFIYGVESLLVTDDEDLQSAREATSFLYTVGIITVYNQ